MEQKALNIEKPGLTTPTINYPNTIATAGRRKEA